MTTVLDARPAPPVTATRTRWQPVALGAIVVLALALYAWGIGSAGLKNTFYAVAVIDR
jgi:hypothetical protein